MVVALVEFQHDDGVRARQCRDDNPDDGGSRDGADRPPDWPRDPKPSWTSAVAAMPEDFPRLIPINEQGLQPCLRFAAGGMLSGTCYRCEIKILWHEWPTPLPHKLQWYIVARFGCGRRGGA